MQLQKQQEFKSKTCEYYTVINVLFPFPGLEASVESRGHVLVTPEAHVWAARSCRVVVIVHVAGGRHLISQPAPFRGLCQIPGKKIKFFYNVINYQYILSFLLYRWCKWNYWMIFTHRNIKTPANKDKCRLKNAWFHLSEKADISKISKSDNWFNPHWFQTRLCSSLRRKFRETSEQGGE